MQPDLGQSMPIESLQDAYKVEYELISVSQDRVNRLSAINAPQGWVDSQYGDRRFYTTRNPQGLRRIDRIPGR